MPHDPGGKTRRPLAEGVRGGAEFDGPDACYRRLLWRSWGVCDAPYALWLGCNPSTADGLLDDPTVAAEIGHTKGLGLTHYLKMNISPYRATNPKALQHVAIPLVPRMHRTEVAYRAMTAARVIVACGVPPGPLDREAHELLDLIAWCGVPLWCLGTTREGWPRHPLYMPADSPIARWYGPEEALGPTHRFFAPDETPADWVVGDALAYRAPKQRRLRDLVYYQVTGIDARGLPVIVPAGHLAHRYGAEVDAWVNRVVNIR